LAFCNAGLAARPPVKPPVSLPCRHTTSCQQLKDIPAPENSRRQSTKSPFANFLRQLPLRAPGTPVRLYSGELKANQSAHYRVIDLDAGQGDLQQCADALMRLRAEFLFLNYRKLDISFRLTSGDPVSYSRWLKERPYIRSNRVAWGKRAARQDSHAQLMQYLTFIYTYAGTASLDQELQKVPDIQQLKIGDIFSQPGFPGHAIMALDLAETQAGHKFILLGQSYMPAQEFHVLKNPASKLPWYDMQEIVKEKKLITPEWEFKAIRLRRWVDP
jgi:hypothetical protein